MIYSDGGRSNVCIYNISSMSNWTDSFSLLNHQPDKRARNQHPKIRQGKSSESHNAATNEPKTRLSLRKSLFPLL